MNPEDSFTHTEASGECEQATGVHSCIQKGLGCGRRACKWYITGRACGHGHRMYGRERTTDNINEQQREQPRMDDGVEEGTKGDTKVYEHEQTAYIAPLTSNPARWKHVILYVRVVPPVVVVVKYMVF